MPIAYVARTDPGRVRPANQDAVLAIAGPNPDSCLLAVADGVGGLVGGAEASQLLVGKLSGAIEEPGETLAQAATAAILAANEAIWEAATTAGRQSGSTIVAVVVDGGGFEVIHAGDSRAYLYRDGTLRQLTEDHSWVADQVRLGLMTAEEAAVSQYRNIITRAVGTEPSLALEFGGPEPARAGDLFLLSSDGLHGLVPAGALEAAMASADDLDATAARLIGLANAAGGSDNISVVLARIGE